MGKVAALLFLLPLTIILMTTLFTSASATTDTTSTSFGDNNYKSILSQLGFRRFASTMSSFLNGSHSFATWSGPTTVFAPPDDSSSGLNLNDPHGIGQYIVPGLFSFSYLKTLPFPLKLETMSPGRCLNIASLSDNGLSINEAEITHPDMFDNGLVIVHGLKRGLGYYYTRCKCSPKCILMSFPLPRQVASDPLMESMIRDAMLRLGKTGYRILAIAMKHLYSKLVNLQNATVFAVPDSSILNEDLNLNYLSKVKYHIVPNRYLEAHDLEKLRSGNSLRTLDDPPCQFLEVTTEPNTSSISISMRRIESYEVMKNLKIVVHSLELSLPDPLGFERTSDPHPLLVFEAPVPRYTCFLTRDLNNKQIKICEFNHPKESDLDI